MYISISPGHNQNEAKNQPQYLIGLKKLRVLEVKKRKIEGKRRRCLVDEDEEAEQVFAFERSCSSREYESDGVLKDGDDSDEDNECA